MKFKVLLCLTLFAITGQVHAVTRTSKCINENDEKIISLEIASSIHYGVLHPNEGLRVQEATIFLRDDFEKISPTQLTVAVLDFTIELFLWKDSSVAKSAVIRGSDGETLMILRCFFSPI